MQHCTGYDYEQEEEVKEQKKKKKKKKKKKRIEKRLKFSYHWVCLAPSCSTIAQTRKRSTAAGNIFLFRSNWGNVMARGTVRMSPAERGDAEPCLDRVNQETLFFLPYR